MAKTVTVYKGWIGGKRSDEMALRSLGVVLGTYNEKDECWDYCSMSPEALKKLDSHWGRYVWGLIPKQEEVYDPNDPDIPF